MGKGRILVVEDESIVAMDIRRILAEAGYEVVADAPSGEEAIAAAARLLPDLVLMDIRLQGEMTGIEAAARIRKESGLPALFVTSYVDQQMLAQAKGMDAVGYVLKPFDDRELVVAVEMAMHRWQVEETLRKALVAAAGEPAAAEASADASPELEIRVLGRLEIALGGRVVARSENLSRTLRSLLGLIMTSQQLRMGQEEVQLALWPESPPERARSSFDSLLLRLRRTLDPLLKPHSIRSYIVLQRGILLLRNCRVDAADFVLYARRGLELAKRGRNQEAKESFAAAFRLWEGPFALTSSEVDRLREFDDLLERLHLDLVLRWSELLAADGDSGTACEILVRALAGDRTNDALVKALYCNCLRQGNAMKAAEVLRQYEEALHRAGFTGREIRDALTDVTTAT